MTILGVLFMGLFFILLSGLFISLSNFSMRRSIDAGGSTKGFFMIQSVFVFLILLFLHPVQSGNYSWSHSMGAFGVFGGVILTLLMISLGKSLQYGPPGLTFAALNASCVVPILFMLYFCGFDYGYVYDFWSGFGSILVLVGLFWAGWATKLGKNKTLWVGLVLTAFFTHVIFLLLMEWRALFIGYPCAKGFLISFTPEDIDSQWFLPIVYGVVTLAQTAIFIRERRKPNSGEIKFGLFGGVLQGVGTFFLMRATEVAGPLERAMLFPIYSVSIIIICNLWGKWVYQEKVNWLANGLCAIGILVGTINWGSLFA